jgi:hypothetical protein
MSMKVLQEIGDPLERKLCGRKVMNESVCNGVAGIPPPTLHDKRANVDHPLGKPSARSLSVSDKCMQGWS